MPRISRQDSVGTPDRLNIGQGGLDPVAQPTGRSSGLTSPIALGDPSAANQPGLSGLGQLSRALFGGGEIGTKLLADHNTRQKQEDQLEGEAAADAELRGKNQEQYKEAIKNGQITPGGSPWFNYARNVNRLKHLATLEEQDTDADLRAGADSKNFKGVWDNIDDPDVLNKAHGAMTQKNMRTLDGFTPSEIAASGYDDIKIRGMRNRNQQFIAHQAVGREKEAKSTLGNMIAFKLQDEIKKGSSDMEIADSVERLATDPVSGWTTVAGGSRSDFQAIKIEQYSTIAETTQDEFLMERLGVAERIPGTGGKSLMDTPSYQEKERSTRERIISRKITEQARFEKGLDSPYKGTPEERKARATADYEYKVTEETTKRRTETTVQDMLATNDPKVRAEKLAELRTFDAVEAHKWSNAFAKPENKELTDKQKTAQTLNWETGRSRVQKNPGLYSNVEWARKELAADRLSEEGFKDIVKTNESHGRASNENKEFLNGFRGRSQRKEISAALRTSETGLASKFAAQAEQEYIVQSQELKESQPNLSSKEYADAMNEIKDDIIKHFTVEKEADELKENQIKDAQALFGKLRPGEDKEPQKLSKVESARLSGYPREVVEEAQNRQEGRVTSAPKAKAPTPVATPQPITSTPVGQENFNDAKKSVILNKEQENFYKLHLHNLNTEGRNVVNSDGSVSTIKNITITEDGKTYIIPTVVNGKIVSNDEAYRVAKPKLKHFPSFNSVAEADAWYKSVKPFFNKDVQQKLGNQ